MNTTCRLRQHYLFAVELAQEHKMPLQESFSHQFVTMAAGFSGNSALAEEHLEHSVACPGTTICWRISNI